MRSSRLGPLALTQDSRILVFVPEYAIPTYKQSDPLPSFPLENGAKAPTMGEKMKPWSASRARREWRQVDALLKKLVEKDARKGKKMEAAAADDVEPVTQRRPATGAAAAPKGVRELKAHLKTLKHGSKDYMATLRALAGAKKKTGGAKKKPAKKPAAKPTKRAAAKRAAPKRKAAPKARPAKRAAAKRAAPKRAAAPRRAAPKKRAARKRRTAMAMAAPATPTKHRTRRRRANHGGKKYKGRHALRYRAKELTTIRSKKTRKIVGFRHRGTGRRYGVQGAGGIALRAAHAYDQHRTVVRVLTFTAAAVGAVQVNKKFPDGVQIPFGIKLEASTVGSLGALGFAALFRKLGWRRTSSTLVDVGVGGLAGTIVDSVSRDKPLIART